MRIKIIIFNILLVLLLVTSCRKSLYHTIYIDGAGIIDFEGNEYKTVVIGDQEWMAENLKSKKYSNGASISNTMGSEDYKIYNNDTSTINTYGLYYNYSAVEDTSGICPCNWHVPSEKEYNRLLEYLGGRIEAMTKLKSKGNLTNDTGIWVKGDYKYEGDNISGFNAVPAGWVLYDKSLHMDTLATFWAVSSVNTNVLPEYSLGNAPYVDIQYLTKDNSNTVKYLYYSIRCIKNLE